MSHDTSLSPTRAEIEALVASVRDFDPYPVWARWPRGQAEFLASLLLHSQREPEMAGITVTYDDDGRADLVLGVRFKRGALAGLAATGAGA